MEADMNTPPKFSVKGNIAYAETSEGWNITASDVDALKAYIQDRLEGPFAFIEIRPPGVSIDPMVYEYANQILPQVVAFALVGESPLTFQTFEVEAAFISDMEFSIFKSLDEAEAWAKDILAKEGS